VDLRSFLFCRVKGSCPVVSWNSWNIEPWMGMAVS